MSDYDQEYVTATDLRTYAATTYELPTTTYQTTRPTPVYEPDLPIS